MTSVSSLTDVGTLKRETTDKRKMSPALPPIQATSMMQVPHRGKPESMMVYVKTEKIDPDVTERSEQNTSSNSMKRTRPDVSISLPEKRRRSGRKITYQEEAQASVVDANNSASTYNYNPNEQSSYVRYPEDGTLNPAAVHCKVEQLPGFSCNSTGPRETDSPASSLHDLGLDYQQINSGNLEDLSCYDQLADLNGIQDDPLLSPNLEDDSGTNSFDSFNIML